MKTFVSMHFCDVWAYIAKVLCRIRANRRPAAYKKIRVLWWWLIAIFSQNSPKMPQKGDFLPKKWWLIRILK